MPYLVCPKDLLRVLSETPPPFLTPSEVRPSPLSTGASAPNTVACSPPSPHSPSGLVWTRRLPSSTPLLTTLQYLAVLTASRFYFRGRKPGDHFVSNNTEISAVCIVLPHKAQLLIFRAEYGTRCSHSST